MTPAATAAKRIKTTVLNMADFFLVNFIVYLINCAAAAIVEIIVRIIGRTSDYGFGLFACLY